MVELSRTWYQGRLELDYEPPTAMIAQGRLEAVGLTGPFWSLTG